MPTSRFLRFLLPVLALALFWSSATREAEAVHLPAEDGRVLVLGFDGGDARTVDAMMKEGELPNLKRLAEMGSFEPLGTTTAAESPVAWASINTGQNPAKTGIPGFVKRGFSQGKPVPQGGHQTSDPLEREDFELTGIMKWLGAAKPPVVAGVAGGAALLLFLLVFVGLLRLRFGVSLVLAALLAAVGAYGAHAATEYLPGRVPGNVRKTNPVDPDALAMWEVAGQAGKRAVVLDAAMAWDRPAIDGVEVLGGLGLPDSRGDNGAWFIYTDSPNEIDAPPNGRSRGLTSGEVFKVRLRPNRLETKIYGIENFWLKEQIDARVAKIEEKLNAPKIGFQESVELGNLKDELLAQLEADNGRVTLPLVVERAEDGQSAKVRIGDDEQTLKEGEWSEFYRLDFELNPLLRSRAITRVKIMSMAEPFKLFVSMLDIDPEYPPFWQPVSQPNMFSRKLSRAMGGPFETYGWACLTMAFKDEEIDPVTMLEDIEFTLKWREAMLETQLDRGDEWDMLFAVFSTPDRVQHMTYHYYDPEHPLYKEEEASKKFTFFGEEIELREAIPAIYRQVDRVVGKVMDRLEENDTLLLCADHGFQSYRRQVHLNNWLLENGYLRLKPGIDRKSRSSLAFVDWENTQAYAVGLGMIYLNLEGREKDGIVKGLQPDGSIEPGSEADIVIQEMTKDFLATVDPETGAKVFSKVYVTREIESGKHMSQLPDLMPGHAPPYHVSWSTTLGNLSWPKGPAPGGVFEDNDKTWSGGHVSVDPEFVRGIFFSNRPLAEVPEDGGVHLLHIAPTALKAIGIEVPASYDRPALELR